jgi:signal transduction histidine kinase
MEGEERKVNWTFSGSYTVEMAYIIAVFCMVMVVLVQQAYRIHDETKSGMKLQEAVEQIRHDEDEQTKEIEKGVKQNLGLMFSMENTDIKLNRGILRVEGNCSGQQKGKAWDLEISSRIYAPEEFLRMMAALKQLEERYEHQLQKGNAP